MTSLQITASATSEFELLRARSELRRQLAHLDRQLVEIADLRGPCVPPHRPGPCCPRLLGLGELEAARDRLVFAVAEARQAAGCVDAERREAARILEAMIADPRRHKLWRISNSQLGLPGCGAYQVRPRLGLIGVLAGWWRVTVSSGCPLSGITFPVSRILLVTCKEFPDGDADDAELPGLLGGARFAVWDDPSVDWAAAELVLIRSPWDYSWRRDDFLAWARGIAGRLLNPVDVLEWNSDKRYLADLRAAGLPVVPTLFVAPGKAIPMIETEVVVKPTVSAGSRDTARYEAKDEAGWMALIGAIHRSGRVAMVQPYVPSVDERGETALVYFGGVYSHAIHKGPLLKPDAPPTKEYFAEETIESREPTAAERAVADRVMAYVADRFGSLAYARVDLVEGPGGAPLLLELELTEPSLFFGHSPGSASRFAAAVQEQLQRLAVRHGCLRAATKIYYTHTQISPHLP